MIYLSEYDCVERMQDNRTEHKLGRSLLAFGLKEEYGRVYSVRQDKGGKPVLEEPGVFFNISHTCGVVVCAVCDRVVGIDAERIRPFDKRLMRRVCTEEEQAYIYQGVREEICRQRFFRLWTLKESYLKATGRGISLPMREVAFSLEETVDGGLCIHSDRPDWQFGQFLYGGRYVVSVCRKGLHHGK